MWPVTWPDSANIDTVDPLIKRLAEMYATTSMTALTLGRVGGDEVTIVPASLPRVQGWYGLSGWIGDFYPTINPSAHNLKRWSDFFRTEAITLPGPVSAVTSVTVGNTVLAPESYRIEDAQYLIRVDGEDWPHDMSGAFTVTYLNSWPVDELGAYAAGALAMEFLKLLTRSKDKCRLPSSVTNVSRQGISFDVARGWFPDGLTGLSEVDAYTALWNPYGLKTRPRVYSPDLPKHRQVTFP